MSAAPMLWNIWEYLSVADHLGFIFLEPMGFFPVLFALVSAVAAVGCAVCMVILVSREVLGDGGATTTWPPCSERSASDKGDGVRLVLGPEHRDLSCCSVCWTQYY